MATVDTELEIWNLALGKLGHDRVSSATEDSKAARLAAQHYEPVRDALLRAHPWNFSVWRTGLARQQNTSLFALPTDSVRIVRAWGTTGGTPLDFRVEGAYVRAATTTAVAEYIRRITNVRVFDPLFVEALAWALATSLAAAFSDAATMVDATGKKAQEAFQAARAADHVEGSPLWMTDSASPIVETAIVRAGLGDADSFDEGWKTVTSANRRLQPTIDAVLRAHSWNVASHHADLTSVAGSGGWDYAATLPAGWVRLVEVTDRAGYAIPYQLERGVVLSNTSLIRVEVVKTTTSAGDPLFVDACAWRLAADLDVRAMRQCMQGYENVLGEARLADSQENPAPAYESEWLRSRF